MLMTNDCKNTVYRNVFFLFFFLVCFMVVLHSDKLALSAGSHQSFLSISLVQYGHVHVCSPCREKMVSMETSRIHFLFPLI